MLADKVKEAVYNALKESLPDAGAIAAPGETPLETPRNSDHGHYSSSAAFALAKQLRTNPIELAEKIAGRISSPIIDSVSVEKPGFINIRVKTETLAEVVPEIAALGERFGRSELGKGKKVQVEFVSANPTGPLSVGHGRIAAYGDCLAGMLDSCGFTVEREFYINNVGNQIKNLGLSLDARYRQALGQDIALDENAYHGDYLIDYAKRLVGEHGDSLLARGQDERITLLTHNAMDGILAEQREALAGFGVEYDTWFPESRLHDDNLVEKTFYFLQQSGYAYEKDGAHWFRSSAFTDKQDRVLKKMGGVPTYFLSDIAYHKNKFDRGFNTIIDIWGADHHGYIDRVKSSMKALGYDEKALEILIVQLVRFKQSGELVRMSKRAGNMITLTDLLEETGRDVARFFFLMRSRESHLDFDLELAKDKSEANPLYYLQYAHARICGILRKAADEGLKPPAGDVDLSPLNSPEELALLKCAADFPWEVQMSALQYEPPHLIHFLTEAAGKFHVFYHNRRVVGDDPAVSLARLALCDAMRTVFKNALNTLGLSAPEEMR